MSKIIDKVRERITLRSSYRRVFETPDGQKILRHLMQTGFVTKSTFVAGDPEQTILNEGTRRLALSILKFVYGDHDKMADEVRKVEEDGK